MHRRIKVPIKTSIIIGVFVSLVMIVFVISLLSLQKTIIPVQSEKSSMYPLVSNDYTYLFENNGKLQIDTNKIISATDYHLLQSDKLWTYIIPTCFVFIIVLTFLTLCLWFILKSIQNKKIIRIAKEMKTVVDEKVLSDEPALTEAYKILKCRFDAQLDNYKRLNAYLTHEQKNGLAILKTNLELLSSVGYLNVIDDIAGSNNDILTLSENIDECPLSEVDVLLVCAEAYDTYSKLADNISFAFDDDEDTEIMAKNRWVYRAVANLLDNAIKYGEGKAIELSIRVKKGSVIIIVKDNGSGIDKDKQELIFNERYRVNELNKDGYGIGLSLVSHVCDLCGGFVTLESELGKGSCFYVSFPQKSS